MASNSRKTKTVPSSDLSKDLGKQTIDLLKHVGIIRNKRLKNMIREGDSLGVQNWFIEQLFRQYPQELTKLRNCTLYSMEYLMDLERQKKPYYLYDLLHMMKIASSLIHRLLSGSSTSVEVNEYISKYHDTFAYLSRFFVETVSMIQKSDIREARFIRNMMHSLKTVSKDTFLSNESTWQECQRIGLKMDEFSFILIDMVNYS
jgi:hypothetical protein